MTILKKELRTNAAGLAVWALSVGGLMAVCVGLYPSMESEMENVSALFAQMGSFSAAFGLDTLPFGSLIGFYGTECGNLLGLGGASYAALTGMGMLAGEEGGGTAEFLLTHPVSRLRVGAEKLMALAVLVLTLNAVCFACGAGAIAAIGGQADWGDLMRLHGAMLLMQWEIGGVCFGLSSLLRRGGAGLGLGLTALLYFAGLIINLDARLDGLRFFTPYFYADAARLLSGEPVAGALAAGCAWAVLGAGFGLWQFRRKDIA